MSRSLVRALWREGASSLSVGGLRGGAVLTGKVPLVGSSLAATAPRRCYLSRSSAPLSVPAISRLQYRNTRTLTPRLPLVNTCNTTRHCSSHASSSLVKMATDRDILSDEYVSLPAFIPFWMLELGDANNFFLTALSRPTTTSLYSTFSLTHPGRTKVALRSILL